MTPEEIEAYIDAKMEIIAERAADKALEKVYAELGKGLVKKALWIFGIAALALMSWMAGKGMKLPSP